MEKEVRADAKLKNLSPEVQDELWRLRNPADEDEKKLTFVEVLAWLKEKRGIDSSLGALSEFYSWLRMSKRMESAKSRAQQAREEMAKDPSATPESIARVGQMMFTAEMVDNGDVKAFVELERLRIQMMALENDKRRIVILETKAAEAKAKLEAAANKAKAGGGISEETLKEIEAAANLL